MTAARSDWRTPRGRFLLSLAGVTGFFVILAAFALGREASLWDQGFRTEPVFANLAMRLADAADITILSKTSSLDIQRNGNDPKTAQWVIPAAHNYPARADRVRKLLLGLTDLKAVERKTARPDWHAALDLEDPKSGGGAISVTVKDSKGNPLAALLIGKLKPEGTGDQPMVYVRRAGENQTYLASGDVPAETERKAWLESTVIDLSRDRTKRVTVAPQGSAAYAVAREKPEEANFLIENMPKGRALVSETAANPVGAAAVDVALEDVRPQGEVDFSKASHIAFETFDGLSVSLELVDVGNVPWARLAAQGTNDAAKKEAEAITARSSAWAYAIPSWKADIFRKPLDSLLKTPEKPAAEPGKPPKKKRR